MTTEQHNFYLDDKHRPPEWGYIHYPGESDGLGPVLDVNIGQIPTELHFDPSALKVDKITPTGEITYTTLNANTKTVPNFRTPFGRILVSDRKGKNVEYFTFGGDVEASVYEYDVIKDKSVGHKVKARGLALRISSPVPIIRLEDYSKLGSPEECAHWFVDKAQALIAGRRVKWGGNDRGFEQRLTSITPIDMYVASLESVLSAVETTPSNHRKDVFTAHLNWVTSRIRNARENGYWPTMPATLDDYFGQDAASPQSY